MLDTYELTPVQQVENTWVKREDLYAPFGYGGVNGSKVRQCMYLINEYVETSMNPTGVLLGASVRSPQLSMVSAIAKSFNLRCTLVIGATKPHTAIGHEQVAIADYYGASFVICKVGYNPVLQSKVQKLSEGPLAGWLKIGYGITLDHHTETPERIEQFHRLGSEQVANLPPDTETLVVPTGSCNTLVSIVYGLARFMPPNFKRLICLQVGPDKNTFTNERLRIIESVTNLDLMGLDREYIDLTQFWSYSDSVPFNFGGIDMHPTYEGKCLKYLSEHKEILNETAVFWNTGAKALLSKIDPDYQRPQAIRLADEHDWSARPA